MSKQYLNQDKMQVLKSVWNYDSFRENQAEAIEDLISLKKDILFLASTGLGKALVFQLPSLVTEGTAIVVSPLLSLMQDQVADTTKLGIRSATYNSTVGKRNKKIILDQLKNNELDLLYIAPESLLNVELTDYIKEHVNVSYLAFDEAHCFLKSTLVNTDKGDLSFKELFDLQENNKELPKALSQSSDNNCCFEQITKIFKNKSSDMLKITLEDNSYFKVTKNHSIFTTKGEVLAKDLDIENTLISVPENLKIISISNYKHSEEYLYDLEVENTHNYFVKTTVSKKTPTEESYILVHNCISSYGHDFRPKYKQVSTLRSIFNVPVIALTATADKYTVEDIKKTLKFNQNNFEFVEYNQNLDRPNLHYNVIKKVGDGFKQITHILDSYDKDSSGIIYCTTKKQTEELAYKLYKKGYKVKAYHSAVKKNEKEQILTEWLENKLQIVIATSAFGTGINKPDTKFVICTTLTPTVEDLVQSLGRAGRDGSDTYVYLLHSPEDIKLIKWMIKNTNLPMSQLENKLTKLQDVQKIVNSKDCIRKQLLSYFNQEYPKENCESCSNCVKSIPL